MAWMFGLFCYIFAAQAALSEPDLSVATALQSMGWVSNTNCGVSATSPIRCNGLNTRITQLYIKNKSKQSIPTFINQLSSLQNLSIINSASGTLPTELTNLTSLINLDLRSNTFTQSIPSAYCGLTNLVTWFMSSSGLTGSMPACLNNMTSLQIIDWSFNVFGAQVPTNLPPNLVEIHLQNCKLTGALPPILGQIPSLEIIDFSRSFSTGNVNAFSGPLPSTLGSSNIKQLLLTQAGLTGSLPSWLGNISTLTTLDLEQNAYTGTPPAELSNLNNLNYLRLSTNHFNASWPLWDGTGFASLQYLYLAWNDFSGPIPAAWSAYTTVIDLDIAGTGVTDISALSAWPQLQGLRLDFASEFRAPFPTAFVGFTAFQSLSAISTTLECDWDQLNLPPALLYLDLTLSGVTGGVTVFPSTLNTFAAANNDLIGDLPDVKILTNLSDIDLSNNPFEPGPIPDFSQSPQIYSVLLANTSRTGPIPLLPAVIYLDLSGNMVTGGLQPLLGFTSLAQLTLGDNQLSGNISVLSTLTNLVNLDLSNNNFSGTIDVVTSFTRLQTCDLSYNSFSGAIPSGLSSLTSLTLFNASHNNFSSLPAGSMPFFQQTCAVNNNNITCPVPSNWNSGCVTSCVCQAGYLTNGSTCTACSAGTYFSLSPIPTCKSCSAGQFTNATAATVCMSCTPGTFATGPGATSCSLCSNGSISAIEASQCTACIDPIAFSHTVSPAITCSCPSGYSLNGSLENVQCVNINECLDPGACVSSADCVDSPGSYECKCKTGYVGTGGNCTSVSPPPTNSTSGVRYAHVGIQLLNTTLPNDTAQFSTDLSNSLGTSLHVDPSRITVVDLSVSTTPWFDGTIITNLDITLQITDINPQYSTPGDNKTLDDVLTDLHNQLQDPDSPLRNDNTTRNANPFVYRFKLYSDVFSSISSTPLPVMIGVFAALFVFISAILLLHWKFSPPGSQGTVVLSCLCAVASLVTLSLLANFLSHFEEVRLYYALVILFVLVPYVINIVITAYILHRYWEETKLSVWIKSHRLSFTLAMLMSGLNTNNVVLMSSKLFNWDSFHAPMNQGMILLSEACGFFTLLCLDIPQLAIQAVLIIRYSVSTDAALALIFTAVRIGLTLVRRGLAGHRFRGHSNSKSKLAASPKSTISLTTGPNHTRMDESVELQTLESPSPLSGTRPEADSVSGRVTGVAGADASVSEELQARRASESARARHLQDVDKMRDD